LKQIFILLSLSLLMACSANSNPTEPSELLAYLTENFALEGVDFEIKESAIDQYGLFFIPQDMLWEDLFYSGMYLNLQMGNVEGTEFYRAVQITTSNIIEEGWPSPIEVIYWQPSDPMRSPMLLAATTDLWDFISEKYPIQGVSFSIITNQNEETNEFSYKLGLHPL